MAKYRKLGRTSSQRKALIRNQVTALLYNGKIVTTEAKAKEIRKVAEGLNLATGAEFHIEENSHYPCVSNPRPMVEDFYDLLDSMEDSVLVEPVMAAEDFAEYQTRVPGLFFFLGIKGGKGGIPLHSTNFDFDEDALLYGLEIFKRILKL